MSANFNQRIDFLPSSLISLKLGQDFNKPINKLPPSLTSLLLPMNFNFPIGIYEVGVEGGYDEMGQR